MILDTQYIVIGYAWTEEGAGGSSGVLPATGIGLEFNPLTNRMHFAFDANPMHFAPLTNRQHFGPEDDDL